MTPIILSHSFAPLNNPVQLSRSKDLSVTGTDTQHLHVAHWAAQGQCHTALAGGVPAQVTGHCGHPHEPTARQAAHACLHSHDERNTGRCTTEMLS